MKKKSDYIPGEFETQKFADKKNSYYKGVEIIKSLNYKIEDFIEYFPCFSGHLTIARYLSFYESYRDTLGLAGHIAEVGTYKGASLLFFAKMVQIFEPNTLTQVHGFDWFKGNEPDKWESKIVKHGDIESYDRLMKLIKAQLLQNTVFVHKLDVTKQLTKFFKKYPHLQFKIVFLDAGMYKVVKSCLPVFWERLTKGGYLILDQFNHEVAPGETKAVKEFLKDKEVRTFPFGWMPTAYIIK
ncbi:MAG: class I SAM-dependent methyltransferase [Ignavibacteriae bacterium]|nr:class I SAM-dependent methyltransferase [Ignavibacteriota bacterium]